MVKAGKVSVDDDYIRFKGSQRAQRTLAVHRLSDYFEVGFRIEQQAKAPTYRRLTFD
ncbi:MAG: hypothetical protein MUC34_01375 [Anaerolineae bacterium]|nr:hypothetical protein [Anaerolineae bacterium]